MDFHAQHRLKIARQIMTQIWRLLVWFDVCICVLAYYTSWLLSSLVFLDGMARVTLEKS